MCEKDLLVLSRDCIFQVLAAENDRVFMIISVLGKDDIKKHFTGGPVEYKSPHCANSLYTKLPAHVWARYTQSYSETLACFLESNIESLKLMQFWETIQEITY